MTHEHDVSARRVVALATAVGNVTEWFDFAVYGFLAAALGRLFLATYVITFLTATMQLGRSEALLLVAAGLVGYAVLTPFAGALSDRFGRRRINLVGGFGLAVVAVPAF